MSYLKLGHGGHHGGGHHGGGFRGGYGPAYWGGGYDTPIDVFVVGDEEDPATKILKAKALLKAAGVKSLGALNPGLLSATPQTCQTVTNADGSSGTLCYDNPSTSTPAPAPSPYVPMPTPSWPPVSKALPTSTVVEVLGVAAAVGVGLWLFGTHGTRGRRRR